MGTGTDYWRAVAEADHRVPADRRLDDLTVELTRMLGSPDPVVREELAWPVLATWVARGVYDDLIVGLGDGMGAGLAVGIGERDTDTVFQRSFSALVLAVCVERVNAESLVPAVKLLEWGDRISTWLVREVDTRGFVPGKGWAHAVAHGADAVAEVARSPHLGTAELTVLLDVLADRVLMPTHAVYAAGEPDRLATATMTVLRRDLVPPSVVEPWVARVGDAASARPTGGGDPFLDVGNAEAFLRALHLQLLLGGGAPRIRSDLLLVLGDALRGANHFLRPPPE